MLPETLGHVFDVPHRLAPSSVAVIQGDTTLTYQDLKVGRTVGVADAELRDANDAMVAVGRCAYSTAG